MGRPRKEGVDWDAIKRHFCEAVRSVGWVGKQYGVTESAIRKMAARQGWIRNPDGEAIREESYRQANESSVAAMQRQPRMLPPPEPTEPFDPEPPSYINQDRLEALGKVGADILLSHRTDIATLRLVLRDMVTELHDANRQQIEYDEKIRDFFEMKALADPMGAPLYKQQMQRALLSIGLNGRSKTMVNITNTAQTLINLERKAWRLDDEGDKRSYEELLAEIAADSKARTLYTPEEAENAEEA